MKGMIYDKRNKMKSLIMNWETARFFPCTVTCWLEFSPADVLVA